MRRMLATLGGSLSAVCCLALSLHAAPPAVTLPTDQTTASSSVTTLPTGTTSTSATTTAAPTLPTTTAGEENGIRYWVEDGIVYESEWEGEGKPLSSSEQFELPLNGATGYATCALPMKASPTVTEPILTLGAGDAFTILGEQGDYWEIRVGDLTGFVEHRTCYLNIPDVIPSMVFYNTNALESVFVSSGRSIDGVTGEKLYDALSFNARLGISQYVMAANYGMVKKICAAQQAALKDGYTLVLYETFRPMDVQLDVAAALEKFSAADSEVHAGLQGGWGIHWFISKTLSTHQIGCAMDVGLAKVKSFRINDCGGYRYREPVSFELCQMPTPIHELSKAAVSLAWPVTSLSKTAWQSVSDAEGMTDSARQLRDYCTKAGMTPLASEWWHFNDLDAKAAIGDDYTADNYFLKGCRSQPPK